MIDNHKQQRADWLAELADPYHEKRQSALEWMRSGNRYCLDRYSRVYQPANGHTPQATIQLKTRL
jgi:hypothetical protein